MPSNDDDVIGFEQEQRLPWLEPIEDSEYQDGVSPSRLVGMVLAGLIVIGLIVGGLWWWQQNGGRPRGDVIAAPEGDYRIPAAEEGGRFDGEGDASVSAAEGEQPQGQVDPNRLPEQPVATPQVRPSRPATPAPARPAVTPARPAAGGGATPAAPATNPPANNPNAPTGGAMIQLGAFASESTAASAWTSLQGRFSWLANTNRTIQAASVNGRTVYRLRANAGTAAAARDFCGRLRIAGENCIVLP
jgi:hypothetical protein